MVPRAILAPKDFSDDLIHHTHHTQVTLQVEKAKGSVLKVMQVAKIPRTAFRGYLFSECFDLQLGT